MPENTKSFMFALCGAITTLAESYGTISSICCLLILLDLLTGLAKAKLQGKINSSIGYQGFWRKIALIAALMFGICLDLLIGYAAGPGFSPPIGRLFGFYIALNKSISICENLAACGVRLPHFITTALESVQEGLNKLRD